MQLLMTFYDAVLSLIVLSRNAPCDIHFSPCISARNLIALKIIRFGGANHVSQFSI
jgi:hypothetical protein